jgi:hypothetical protein
MPAENLGTMQVFTTGSPASLAQMLPILLGENHPVRRLKWDNDFLELSFS